MEKITVPVVPLNEEEKVAKYILKSAAKEPAEKYIPHFDKGDFSEIRLVLFGIGMEKYVDNFVRSKVTLDIFLQLQESDLRELGITDAKDIEIIMKNKKSFDAKQRALSVPISANHDLQIARNVRNELILLQNYCSYLELQMRKHKLRDYRISWKESASEYLKAFVETASLQARILSHKVFHDSGDDHLIGKVLKLSNLPLSNHLKEKLEKKKHDGRHKVLYYLIILGVLSLTAAVKFFY